MPSNLLVLSTLPLCSCLEIGGPLFMTLFFFAIFGFAWVAAAVLGAGLRLWQWWHPS